MEDYLKPQVEELSQNVHLLTFGEKQKLYLIGTAHVSLESVKLVEQTIEEIKPDVVCVELDEQRYQKLKNERNYRDIDLIQIIRQKQLFSFIGQILLSSFQKKIASKTGSSPGREFKVAYKLAEQQGAQLVLADRNIGVTLKRAWRLTRFIDKIKLFGSLFSAPEDEIESLDIEKLKTMDAINNLIKHFGKTLPITKKVLIDERDLYLTRQIQKNLGQTTVAVVGAGHVPGMLKCFNNKISDELSREINFIPPPSKIGKIISWIIPTLIIGIFITGFVYGRKEVAEEVLIFWVLANGLLSSLGCLLALAHPLTILAGFIAAPITSLNPTIGAGFVTALVQAFMVKPRIKDFEEIQSEDFKLRHWWQNRLTKIFLVFFFSSIGSTIGTFVALPALKSFFS